MRNLAALRVKILRHPDGSANYPDFNRLSVIQDSGQDWSVWVDANGSGWLYDAVGHEDDEETDPPSPHGEQWGVLLVPRGFVNQAVAMFPGRCERLNQVDFESFYDGRIARDFEDEEFDTERLQAVKLKQDLGVALTTEDNEAIDPNNDRRGIRKNPRKTAARFLGKRKIAIDETE